MIREEVADRLEMVSHMLASGSTEPSTQAFINDLLIAVAVLRGETIIEEQSKSIH